MTTFKPSIYQQAIYDLIQFDKGNAVVSAVAGSGKTTTILNALKLIPTSKKVAFLAFNRSIVSEIKTKVPQTGNINVSTLHSFGFSALKNAFSDIVVDNMKYMKLLNNIMFYLNGENKALNCYDFEKSDLMMCNRFAFDANEVTNEKNYFTSILKLVDLGRANNVCLNEVEAVYKLEELAEKHGVELINGECVRAYMLIKLGSQLTDVIDYVDMLFLPIVYNLPIYQYDFVFVDECQDLNNCQRILMLKAIKKNGGRFIAVGDPQQAIYGFAGADINSYNELCNTANTVVLPLSVCYRCGSKIIELAQEIVPQILPRENAPEGEVLTDAKLAMIKDGDMVLCRVVFPLVKLCMGYLSAGIKATLMGSDIGANLSNMIKNQERKREVFTMENVFARLNNELSKVLKKIVLKERLSNEDAKLTTTYTSYLEKILVIQEIAGTEINPVNVMDKIKSIFSDTEKEGIILSSIHKSKGLESDRVFIVHSEKLPLVRKNMKDWEMVQEKNLEYVAYTRAKNTLGFITDFNAYDKAELNLVSNAEIVDSVYMGEVGQKVAVRGLIIEIKELSTCWGDTLIYVIKTDEGNIVEKMGVLDNRFVDGDGEVEQGARIKFNGTVKKHQEYKGEKKTIISNIAKLK